MNYDQLRPGLVIAYRLLSRDLPTRPERLWHGRIEDVSRSGASPLVPSSSLPSGFTPLPRPETDPSKAKRGV